MNKTLNTKLLAYIGTILVWLPVLAPFFFSLRGLGRGGRFNFDYLLPAELGIVVFLGAAFLLWAALRAKQCVKAVIWIIAAAFILFLGFQALAVVTGLASGAAEMGGWEEKLVLAGVILYDLTVVALGVCGINLIRRLS